MAKTKEYRKFLCDDADSYISVYTEREGGDMNASLKLADCNRNVNIDFSVWRHDSKKITLKKRLAKLAIIEEGLARIRRFLESEGANEHKS